MFFKRMAFCVVGIVYLIMVRIVMATDGLVGLRTCMRLEPWIRRRQIELGLSDEK